MRALDFGEVDELEAKYGAELVRELPCLPESGMTGANLLVNAKAVRNSKAGTAAVVYPQLIEALAAFVESDRVFCQEAAYWAETVEELESCDPAFSQVEAAAVKLAAIELLGLEDNSLIACQ